jgi:hypothetical protein
MIASGVLGAGSMRQETPQQLLLSAASLWITSRARRQHSLTDGVEASTFIGRRVERPILSPAVATLTV